MTEEQKKQLIIELINARRKRFGFKNMLTINDTDKINSVDYKWAKDNVEIFEKFLASIK